MHTFLTRANALAAYTMSVLAGLTMVCFLSTFFLDYKTGSKINTVKVVVKHVPDYSASREKVRNTLHFAHGMNKGGNFLECVIKLALCKSRLTPH